MTPHSILIAGGGPIPNEGAGGEVFSTRFITWAEISL